MSNALGKGVLTNWFWGSVGSVRLFVCTCFFLHFLLFVLKPSVFVVCFLTLPENAYQLIKSESKNENQTY